MDPSMLDFLVQTLATVVGGAILFLLGLLLSALVKKTKQYAEWLSKNWRILLAAALLLFTAYGLFGITGSLYAVMLAVTLTAALNLVSYHIINRTEDGVVHLFKIHEDEIRSVKTDLIMEEASIWELKKVPKNVLSYACSAMQAAPDKYHAVFKILDTIERALRQIGKEDDWLYTFEASVVHGALAKVPDGHTPQRERISALLKAIRVR